MLNTNLPNHYAINRKKNIKINKKKFTNQINLKSVYNYVVSVLECPFWVSANSIVSAK